MVDVIDRPTLYTESPITAATTVVSDRPWTFADLEALPEGSRYELLEGILYMTAMPAWPHGQIVMRLIRVLDPWINGRKLGIVLAPQNGIYLNEVNYIDPDLIFLRSDQIPITGDRPRSAALAIEVLSPSNMRAPRDRREKLFARAGVSELWYVNHETQALEVRRLGSAGGYETARTLTGEESVRTDVLPGLEFALTALWRDN